MANFSQPFEPCLEKPRNIPEICKVNMLARVRIIWRVILVFRNISSLKLKSLIAAPSTRVVANPEAEAVLPLDVRQPGFTHHGLLPPGWRAKVLQICFGIG